MDSHPSIGPPQVIRSAPPVLERLAAVKKYRLGELPPRNKPAAPLKAATSLGKSLADTPAQFHVTVLPDQPYLAIPEVSSEGRDYIPIGWLQPPTVPSNKLIVCLKAEPYQFALITSKMHMAWTAFVGGRLESRYQYSPGINYNPFPWPQLSEPNKIKLGELAQAILDARTSNAGATLADLYEPKVMPRDLRLAHRALDQAVDRLYRKAPFDSDRERVEHLFTLYERMTAGLLAAPGKSKRRKKADA